MASTYLDLTNEVLRRVNEVELTASSFASARGIHAHAKDAVLATLRKMNSERFEWPFNSAVGTQVCVVGQEDYTWPSDLRIPDWESFYIEKDDTLNINTTRLRRYSLNEYREKFRDADLDSTTDGLNIPEYVYELSSGGFGIAPSPDQLYTIKFKYFINTITMSDYDDTTTIPDEYTYVIIDGALEYMYIFLDNTPRAQMKGQDFKRGLDYMSYILIPKAPYVRDMRMGHHTNPQA